MLTQCWGLSTSTLHLTLLLAMGCVVLGPMPILKMVYLHILTMAHVCFFLPTVSSTCSPFFRLTLNAADSAEHAGDTAEDDSVHVMLVSCQDPLLVPTYLNLPLLPYVAYFAFILFHLLS